MDRVKLPPGGARFAPAPTGDSRVRDADLAREACRGLLAMSEILDEGHEVKIARRAHLGQAACARRAADTLNRVVHAARMQTPIRTGMLRLKQWRNFRNLTLQEVADILSVNHSTVQRWEVRNVMLEPAQVAALAAAYGCSPAELMHPPEDRLRGQLMHRLLTAFQELDPADAEAAVGIVERMPSAKKR